MNYFSLLFFALLLLSCGDDDLSLEDLPPATQTGEHTFGCIVNGDVFVAQSSANGTNRGASYQYNPFDRIWNFTIYGTRENDGFFTLDINSKGIEISEGIYNFYKENDYDYLRGEYTIIKNAYIKKYWSFFNGQLTITRFDRQNGVCSGTFWFDAKDEETGELVEVRDGRFDVILIL